MMLDYTTKNETTTSPPTTTTTIQIARRGDTDRSSNRHCRISSLILLSFLTQTAQSYTTISTHRQCHRLSQRQYHHHSHQNSNYHRHPLTTTTALYAESPFKLRRRIRSTLLGSSSTKNNDTWSRPGTSSPRSVRSRVRQVLAKARGRTGIDNNTETDNSANVIAEAASIGGIGPVYNNNNGATDPSSSSSPRSLETLSSSFDYIPSNATTTSPPPSELDSLVGDLPAAFSLPPPPYPFSIPTLTPTQKAALTRGERVQFQTDMGLEGSGFVVVDVKAPSRVVWDCLLDFHSYPDLIPTVRDVTMYTNTHLNEDYYHEDKVEYEDGRFAILKHGIPSVTRAAFTLSKFKLKIAAIHKYRPHPKGDYMIFTLDGANKNLVLQDAKGIWHTQSNPDGKGKDYTRVWLLCELRVSKLLPKFIVDYAAKKAMPRATTWLKPQVETAAALWLRDDVDEE